MILDEICARRRQDVARARAERPLADPVPRAEPHRLSASLARPGHGLICEIKKASPSRGPIDPELDVARRAREYQEGGARAISVLTEPHWFGGTLADLEAAGRAADVPLLRKDFVVDEYQVVETAHSPAAALLLIVAALEKRAFLRLFSLADDLGIDCLVEVHTEAELDVALASRARLIGVNNRNLKDLKVDLAVSERLIPRIPADRIAIAESGFTRPEDVARLAALGTKAFLIGEALMTSGEPTAKMRELLAVGRSR